MADIESRECLRPTTYPRSAEYRRVRKTKFLSIIILINN
jgi:hypothetical protein